MKLHELQEKRAAAVTAMRALADLAETEKRDLTADEDTRFGALKTEIADLDKKIGRAQTLAEAERSAPAIVHGTGDGRFEDRAADFSIVKAIRGLLPRDLGGGDVDIGFEREISGEVARRSGRTFAGLAVPDQIFVERRTLLAGSTAADLIPTVHDAQMFIDRLRARIVCARLGATYLDGLVGAPIDIPRQTGSSSAQWLAEDASLSDDDASFDDVVLAPKTVGALTSYSRRTLLNASPGIEQIVRNDLAAVIANAVDQQAMLGDGTGNKPIGIVNSGAINTGMTTPTWEDVLNFAGTVDFENALNGALGWAMAPPVRTKLMATLVAASTDSRMIMSAPDQLTGYPAVTTTALPGSLANETPVGGLLIFGDWSDLLIGSWTGVDLLINPYESVAYAKGRVLVRAMKDLDIAVRHPESFAFSNNVTTA